MTLKATLLFLLALIGNNDLYGENPALSGTSSQKDGRSMALGDCFNGVDQNEQNGFSVNYILPYNLNELSTRSLKINQQSKWMMMEGFWSQTGDPVFMENYMSVGVSRFLSASFVLGARAGYFHYSMICGNKGSTILPEVFCNYRPIDKWKISVYLFNPTGSKIKQKEKCISVYQSFHLGCSYFPTKNMEWLLEMEKVQLENISVHMGIEYVLCESFCIRTGLSTPPFMPSWGIGGKIKQLKYALGGNMHPVLGVSSGLSLYYTW